MIFHSRCCTGSITMQIWFKCEDMENEDVVTSSFVTNKNKVLVSEDKAMGLESLGKGPAVSSCIGFNDFEAIQEKYPRDNGQGKTVERFLLRNKNNVLRSSASFQCDVECDNCVHTSRKSDEINCVDDVTLTHTKTESVNSARNSPHRVKHLSNSESKMSIKCASRPGTENITCSLQVHQVDVSEASEVKPASVLQVAVQAIKKVPFADPDEVQSLLESGEEVTLLPDTSQKCYKDVKSSPSSESCPEDPRDESSLSVGSNQVDSVEQDLMKDVDEIFKIFPNKDQYEIYAYLEAHVHKPDRVQIVVDELLSMRHSSLESSLRSSPVECCASSPNLVNQISLRIKTNQLLRSLFPRVDTKVFDSILKNFDLNTDRGNSSISEVLLVPMYPKLQECFRRKLDAVLQESNVPESFVVTTFLELFDNPEEFFYDESKTVSAVYKKHAVAHLYQIFSDVSREHIDAILHNHRFHYTPALRQLENELNFLKQTFSENPKRMKINDEDLMKNLEIDEKFLKEKIFTELEEEILEYKRAREESRYARISEARTKDELLTCSLCYDDDLLNDEMLTCPDGHNFCQDCIRREAEETTVFANSLVCCTICAKPFELTTLEKILKPSVYSSIIKQRQLLKQHSNRNLTTDTPNLMNQQTHDSQFKPIPMEQPEPSTENEERKKR